MIRVVSFSIFDSSYNNLLIKFWKNNVLKDISYTVKFDGVWIKFVIHVFDLSHVKSAQFRGQTLSFNVSLETVDDCRNSSFVL